MALTSDAAMVLFYDFEGDPAGHDTWHSREHLHERLSVPGFLRASRWVSTGAGPRCLVIYEVDDVAVATSPAYLERLEHPTPWTAAVMPRFRGMTRGFGHVVAASGHGLGAAALAVRFEPEPGAGERLSGWIAQHVLPAVSAVPGIMSTCLFRPAPPPPMTREQSLRGPDTPMPWLLLATAYDPAATAGSTGIDPAAFVHNGAAAPPEIGRYALHCVATTEEVARTTPS